MVASVKLERNDQKKRCHSRNEVKGRGRVVVEYLKSMSLKWKYIMLKVKTSLKKSLKNYTIKQFLRYSNADLPSQIQ